MSRTQRTQFKQAAALALVCALAAAVPVFAEGEAGKKVEPASPPRVGVVSDTTGIVDRNHHLGPGDTVEIIVDGYPQFSRTVKLFADGSFDFPVLETVQAIGLTTKELREHVTEGLLKELRRPIVYVNLTSIYVPPPPPPLEVKIPRISAYGAVGRKGQMELPQPRPFRQIIQELGTTERADLTNIRIRYPDGSARTVDVSDFATKGEFKDDILIKGGEEIIVVERPEVQRPEPIRVEVLGNVTRSGFVTFEGNAPILEVLEKVGGPKAGSALDRVKIVSGKIEHFVDVEKYMHGDVSANYFCRNGDIVTVLEKPLRIVVFGEVSHPGDIAINEGETLSKVILNSGVSTNADKTKVELIRQGKDGKVERKSINVTAIERQKKDDVALMRGDVLFVPNRTKKKGIVDYLSMIASPIWLLRTIAPTGGF
jgi:protein involved in polysaccharide export with SLBB domain